MDPPTDPPSNRELSPRPLMPTTSQVSLATPLEPRTFEDLIHSSRRDKFPSNSTSWSGNDDGHEAHDASSEGNLAVTSLPEPHGKFILASCDTTLLPFPSHTDTISEDLSLQASPPVLEQQGSSARDAARHDSLPSQNKNGSAPSTHTSTALEEDRKGKAKERYAGGGREQTYFGSGSEISQDSVRCSPKDVKSDYESFTHHQRTPWIGGGGEQTQEGDVVNCGLGVDIPEDGNQTSNSSQGDGWGGMPSFHQFEAHTGDAQIGRGAWGGNNGGGWNRANNNNPRTRSFDTDDWKVFDNDRKQRRGHARSRHPSLVQNSAQAPRGAEPSRRLSEATVRPFPQPQQQISQHLPSPEMHTHYHHHNYNNNAQNLSSEPQQHERDYMHELREQNANQTELLTEQRIRIAVLENDLKHLKKLKKEAIKASVFIAQNLGSSFVAPGSPSRQVTEAAGSVDRDHELKMLKLEVARLKKDNSLLESFIDNSIKHFDEYPSSSNDSDEDIQGSSTKAKGTGKERMAELSNTLTSSAPTHKGVGEEFRGVYKKGKTLTVLQRAAAESFERFALTAEKPSLSDRQTNVISGWNESFSSDVTTVPNSPNLNYSSFSSAASGNQFAETFLPVNRMSDVGLQSLDDYLEGNMDLHLSTTTTRKENAGPLSIQSEAHLTAMSSFASVPTPSVLKTGFDLTNAKRGAQYDYLAPQPEPHDGDLKTCNRFGDTAAAKPYSYLNSHEMWNSFEERDGAISVHQSQIHRDGIRYPDMFRYGIQYAPEEDDENYLRTVSIINLPSSINLRGVLERVRGGLIANAILMDTRRLMGGRMSAIVVFVDDYDARSFVEYAAAHPITFGENGDASKANIVLVPTPTYPMSQGMIRHRKQDQKNTRYLVIPNFPTDISLSKLHYDIACRNGHRADNLIEIYLDENNTLHLKFSNISLAISSSSIITKFSLYRGLEVNYEADPCAGPLEELALPVPPRPPMLPKSRLQSPYYNIDFSMSSNDDQAGNLASVGEDVVQMQRRRPAALSNQKIDIPTFSGANFKSGSWADEVIEESELSDTVISVSTSSVVHASLDPEHDEPGKPLHIYSAAPPNSPVDGIVPIDSTSKLKDTGSTNALMITNVNVLMKDHIGAFRKAPVGLAGSKYATVVPRFKDKQSSLKTRIMMRSTDQKTACKDDNEVELLMAGANDANTSSTSKKDTGGESDCEMLPQSLTELETDDLLAAAFIVDTEDSPELPLPDIASSASTCTLLAQEPTPREPQRPSEPTPNLASDDKTPRPGQHLFFTESPPDKIISSVLPDPFDTPSPAKAARRRKSGSASEYVLEKPTYSPYVSPVQKSPTQSTRYSGPVTALESFNYKIDRKERKAAKMALLQDPNIIDQHRQATSTNSMSLKNEKRSTTPSAPDQSINEFWQYTKSQNLPGEALEFRPKLHAGQRLAQGDGHSSAKDEIEMAEKNAQKLKNVHPKTVKNKEQIGKLSGELGEAFGKMIPDMGLGSDSFIFAGPEKSGQGVYTAISWPKAILQMMNPDEIELDEEDDQYEVEKNAEDGSRGEEKRCRSHQRYGSDHE